MNRRECPSQFDVDIYRALHDDLATMSVEQAVHHYFEFGEDEGRRSHSLLDRMQFGQLAPERTLEIGPFAFPCLRGEKVKYADIYSTEKLRDLAKTSGFDPHSVPEIHYVVEPTNLSAIAGRFDGVFQAM